MGDTSGEKNAFYSQVKQLGILTTIPIILAVGPAIGFFIGSWIDRKAQCYPWVTIIFVFLGFVASGREIARLLKQILKSDQAESTKTR
jgi:F0F1-type ATP synthase assembly protein I